MWLRFLFALGRWASSPARRFPPAHCRRPRLTLECLEERALPSSYTAGSVSDLIADINAANKASGSNTITLTAPTTSPYVLTAVDNSTDGANGLPVIKQDNLTIIGNGDTIGGNIPYGAPAFRLFDVAKGGSLTLESLTLQGGLANGSGTAAEGGAIFNQGTLVLNGATVTGNVAEGANGSEGRNPGNGKDAAGGGIWSNGALTLENTLVQGNDAWGGNGGIGMTRGGFGFGTPGIGGNAFGGGLYIAGGTVTLTSSTLSKNTAEAGYSGYSSGQYDTSFGGGLYVAGGSVTLTNTLVQSNVAGAPFYTPRGSVSYFNGYGGGIFIASGATVNIDSLTLISNNTAQYGPDIYPIP
jgi:hypothetical protein